MLFRTYTGTLVELKIMDFTNDYIYYKKIMELKSAHIIVVPIQKK